MVKRSKCAFAQQKIEYLGHFIYEKGLETDPVKVEEMRDWPIDVGFTQHSQEYEI